MFAAALSGDAYLSDFPHSAFDFRAGAVHARQPHPDGDRVDLERSAGSVPDRDRSHAHPCPNPGRYSDADCHLDPFPDGEPHSLGVEHRYAAHGTSQRQCHDYPHSHAAAYRHAHADPPSDQHAACHKHPKTHQHAHRPHQHSTTHKHTDRLNKHLATHKNAGRPHKPSAADADSDRPDKYTASYPNPDTRSAAYQYATSRPEPDTGAAADKHTTASTDGSPGNRSTTDRAPAHRSAAHGSTDRAADRSTGAHDLSIAGLHMISETLRPPLEAIHRHSPTAKENRAHESSLE